MESVRNEVLKYCPELVYGQFQNNNQAMRLNQNKCKVCSSSSANLSPSKTKCCDKIICQNCAIDHQCSILIVESIETKCMRCTVEKASFKCSQCELGILCQICDRKIHQKGKFSLHQRLKYQCQGLELYQQNNPYRLSMSHLKPKQNIKNYDNDMVVLNIRQTWDQIKQDLQTRFKEIIDLVADKQKQILNKIEKRKQKELVSYKQAKNQLEDLQLKGSSQGNLRKSQVIEKFQTLQKKLQSLELDYSYADRKSKFSIANCQFDSIKSTIQRIQIKGLLLKIVSQPQKSSKNKMRSSVILSNNSGCDSATIYRTPKNGKSKMSASTLQADFKDGIDKPNEEDQRKKESLKSNKIQKVKSEKLFSKASGSLKSYFYDRIKKKGQ